jgi:hypothetical protein
MISHLTIASSPEVPRIDPKRELPTVLDADAFSAVHTYPEQIGANEFMPALMKPFWSAQVPDPEVSPTKLRH